MTKPIILAFTGFAIGVHSIGLLVASMLDIKFLLVWCGAFLVYHSIVLRRLLREGVQA